MESWRTDVGQISEENVCWLVSYDFCHYTSSHGFVPLSKMRFFQWKAGSRNPLKIKKNSIKEENFATFTHSENENIHKITWADDVKENLNVRRTFVKSRSPMRYVDIELSLDSSRKTESAGLVWLRMFKYFPYCRRPFVFFFESFPPPQNITLTVEEE